jgi:hypothetical protein
VWSSSARCRALRSRSISSCRAASWLAGSPMSRARVWQAIIRRKVGATLFFGNEQSLEFIHAGSEVTTAKSGVPNGSTTTITSESTWLGQLGSLTYLDSTTGKTLASSHVEGTGPAAIAAVASSNGQLYSTWQTGGDVSLIHFIPPQSCTPLTIGYGVRAQSCPRDHQRVPAAID